MERVSKGGLTFIFSTTRVRVLVQLLVQLLRGNWCARSAASERPGPPSIPTLLGLWRLWEELLPWKQLMSQVEHRTLSSPPSSGTSGRGDPSTVHWASSHPDHPGRGLPDSLSVLEASSPSETGSPEVVWAGLTLPKANQDLGNAVENPWHTKCCQEGEPP